VPPTPPSEHRIAASIRDIDDAADEMQLHARMAGARAAVAAELAAHTPELVLAAAWSEVLLHGVATGVRLAGPGDWSWYVSGSVARGEAVPGSDVETMVVLGDGVDADAKVELLSRAAAVHALLERCAVPGDANGVLASRPRFCRREGSWAEGIERWACDPREDRGVVMTGLMADSTGLPTVATPPRDLLRAQTASAASRNPPVRRALLQDATAVRATVPSRLRLLARNADTVDVKLAALDPVVKIARWAALSAGSPALSTLDRLDDAATARTLDADDVTSLRDCFEWLVRFRWRLRAASPNRGPASDEVSLSDMAPQDRAALRSVAREVTGICRKLTYLASTSSLE
jgi:CBS domain-containing protein